MNALRKSRKTYKNLSPMLVEVNQEVKLAIHGDRQEANEEAIRKACYLIVRYGRGAHSSAKEVNALLPPGKGYHSDFALWEATGGEKVLAERLAKGGVIPKGSFGRWSPDFWTGLVSSGAIREVEGKYMWMTSTLSNRPALREAFMSHLPFHCRIGKSYKGIDRLTIYGLWAAKMWADDPSGTEVLAGLLAGGRLAEHDGRLWIGVACRPGNATLFQSYGIPFFKPKGKSTGRGSYFVSPFWGALLSEEMPEVFGRWFWGLGGPRVKKGMCPLLPWAFLRMASGVKFTDYYPQGVVPYLAQRVGLRVNHGIGMGAIREEALRQFGYVSVDPRLRMAWMRGMALRGLCPADFPEGKVPVDFTDVFCHDVVCSRESLPKV